MAYQVIRGNTLTEYAIIFGLLILVAFGGVKLLGNSINGLFTGSSNTLQSQPLQDLASMKFDTPLVAVNGGSTGAPNGQGAPGKSILNGAVLSEISSGGTMPPA